MLAAIGPRYTPTRRLKLVTELDTLLREFLEKQRVAEAKGYTAEALLAAVSKVVEGQTALRVDFETHEGKDDGRHKETLGAIAGLQAVQTTHEERLSALEEATTRTDDSGQHMRAKLDSVDHDLDVTEKALGALRQENEALKSRTSDISKMLEATRKERDDEVRARLLAENAELKTAAASEKAARTADKRELWVTVRSALITFAVTAVGGGVIYLLTHIPH